MGRLSTSAASRSETGKARELACVDGQAVLRDRVVDHRADALGGEGGLHRIAAAAEMRTVYWWKTWPSTISGRTTPSRPSRRAS